MADTKITDLASLTGAGAAATDVVPLVDVSDTSMAPSGTDKKITVAELGIALGSVGGLATTAAVAAGYQPLDSDLTAIAALTTTTFGRALLTQADAAAARTALGLGTAATASTGTGAANVPTITDADARYQPLDSDLTAIAALTTTTFGRSILTQADAAATRTALGLVIGTNVQAYDADLADIAGITPSQGDIIYRNATNWVRLAAGTSGHYLKTQGAGANPAWDAVSAGTTVSPAPLTTLAGSNYAWNLTMDTASLHSPASSTITANRLYYEPFWCPGTCTVTGVGLNVATLSTGSARIGIAALGQDMLPKSLIVDAGTVAVTSTGFKSITGLTATLTGGAWYAKVFICDGTPQLSRSEAAALGYASSSNVLRFVWAASAASQFTALSNPPTAPDGTDAGTHVGFFHHVFMRWTS